MGFFENYRIKEQAKDFLKAFRKQRVYNSDLLPPARLEEARGYEDELAAAVRAGAVAPLPELLDKGDRIARVTFPSRQWDGWRENVEVIFVAIVAALALRAYFLQPFKIPTDSMKPTLYGIQTVPGDEAAPVWPVRIFQQLAYGRTYGHVQFDHPVTLIGLRGGQLTPWFEYTDLIFESEGRQETARVWTNEGAVESRLGLRPGMSFEANQVVTNFVNETGDQVLVNKLIYNFRLPHRGEVFVFKTTGIAGIEDSLRREGIEGSEFYIKRCVGVAGDTLRVIPPLLEINGRTDGVNAAMKRVEAGTYENPHDGYRGYSRLLDPVSQHFLRTPNETYHLEPDEFWAMGDNSYNSSDSRFWGPVPRANLVGTGFVVYWPFGPRWGVIR